MYIADKGRAFKEKSWESGIVTLSYRMLDLWEETELKMSAEEYENIIRKHKKAETNLIFRKDNIVGDDIHNFAKNVERIAVMYSEMVENQLKDKKSIEELPEINEGIRLLNYIANTIERIARLKN